MTSPHIKKPASRLLVGCLLISLIASGCTTTGSQSDDQSVASSDDEFSLDDDGGSADSEAVADNDSSSTEDLDADGVNDSTPVAAATEEVEDEFSMDEGEDAVPSELASAELSDDLDVELDAASGNGAPAVAEAAPQPAAEPRMTEIAVQPEPETSAVAAEPAPAPVPVSVATAQAEPSVQSTEAAVGQPSAQLTDLRYVAKQNGGTVVIQTSEPATYNTREVPSQNQVIIEIANAHLPAKFKRPYVTKDFGQAIASINAYQDSGSSTIRVVVQFKTATRADVQQSGKALTVTAAEILGAETNLASAYDGSERGPAEADAQAANIPKADIDADDTGTDAGQQGSYANAYDPRILPASQGDLSATEITRFYGRPISIEVRDTPVRDVINLIAEQSGANIVLSSEVDGNISLKLRQIPWDQALLIVMKTRGLGYARQGSILRVAPYEALQKEADAARKVVEAQRAAEPLRVKIIPVGYAKVDKISKNVEAFLSKERGKVVADERTNSLIVTDTPDVLERVANLVKALDLPPLQVLIEGKVVEARDTFARDFGINWGASGGSPMDVGGKNLNLRNISINTGSLPSAGNVNFTFGTLDFLGDLNAAIGLLEKEDVVKVVSSPRVTALNNEGASILQGENISVLKANDTPQGRTITYEYVPVEMKLDVRPQVTSENDVILEVEIKREFAGSRETGAAPDIAKRQAKTKLLVRNGGTAVVGGVYQSDTIQSETGVPWLKDIPVLGWLFKGRRHQNTKNELLVFLTPRILNPDKAQKENDL